jgi:hypothetical protein
MEPVLEIDDGGNLATEIDDSLHVGKGVGKFGDGGILHYFPHIKEIDSKVFLSKKEFQYLE